MADLIQSIGEAKQQVNLAAAMLNKVPVLYQKLCSDWGKKAADFCPTPENFRIQKCQNRVFDIPAALNLILQNPANPMDSFGTDFEIGSWAGFTPHIFPNVGGFHHRVKAL